MGLFRKFTDIFESDNAAIRKLLKNPIGHPPLPILKGDVQDDVATLLKAHPAVLHAAALRSDLFQRIRNYPCLAREIDSQLRHRLFGEYNKTVDNLCSRIQHALDTKKKLVYEDYSPYWEDNFRINLLNDIILRDAEFWSMITHPEDDVTQGTIFKKEVKIGKFDKCRYSLTNEGFGVLALTGELFDTKNDFWVEVSFEGDTIRIDVTFTESAAFRRTENIAYIGAVSVDLRKMIQQYRSGIHLILQQNGNPSGRISVPAALKGCKSNGIDYDHQFDFTDFSLDMNTNKLVGVPGEWQNLKSHPAAWVIAVAGLQFPEVKSGQGKALQSRLRTLGSKMWVNEFNKFKKKAPALPPMLSHVPSWSDVSREAIRVVEAAQ